MKIFLIIACVFCSLISLAQDDVSIRHYQKKWSTDTVHLPCDKWDARDLLIPIPDSVYNAGTVRVKKLKYKGVKGFGYMVTLKEARPNQVIITCKGKKQLDMLLELDYHLNKTYQNNKECPLKSFLNASKRRGTLKISINSQTYSP